MRAPTSQNIFQNLLTPQGGPGGMPRPAAGMTPPAAQPAAQPSPVMRPGVMPATSPGPMPSGQQLDPAQLEAEAQRILQENPEAVAQVRQQLMQAIQNGQFTLEELQMGVQMAKAALRNPDMYPQLRALAIERGMASPDALSPEYDPGYLFLIILGGEAVVGAQGGADAGVGVRPSMANGGPLPERSNRADGVVPINAHEGEYVIPAHVVRAKGTEFFDKLLDQYNESSD